MLIGYVRVGPSIVAVSKCRYCDFNVTYGMVQDSEDVVWVHEHIRHRIPLQGECSSGRVVHHMRGIGISHEKRLTQFQKEVGQS